MQNVDFLMLKMIDNVENHQLFVVDCSNMIILDHYEDIQIFFIILRK
jgi:hypothetical protein